MTGYLQQAQLNALVQDQVASEMVSMYVVFVSLQLAVAPAFSFFFMSSLRPLLATSAKTVASQNPVGQMVSTAANVAGALSFTMPVAKIGTRSIGSTVKGVRGPTGGGGMAVRRTAPQILLPGSPGFNQARSALPRNLKTPPK